MRYRRPGTAIAEGTGHGGRWAIIQAPSVLGLRPTGVQDLPTALLTLGLAECLGARQDTRVDAPEYNPVRDPATGMLNPLAIRDYSITLADSVGAVLDRGEMPLVLGGDCSILLGGLLALRRRGRYGLLFLDGHADFYQPAANVNGEAASSELAIATGRGPAVMSELEGYLPLVRDEDIVVFAHRDGDEAARYGSQPLPGTIRSLDLNAVRELGAPAAVRQSLAHLDRPGVDGFWIHLDADVLDDAVMPAVDYRLPGGLSPEELGVVLREAWSSGRAVGLEVTIYNPRLDPDGSAGGVLQEVLATALRR